MVSLSFKDLCKIALLAFVPSIAVAQSTISGIVRDTTGAVMPGVTVEASSPALIERSRTVTTDNAGAYAIVDVRPGTYVVSFSAPSFATLKKEDVEVPSSVTVNISVEMKIGAVGETVSVEATAPVVDVQNVAHPEVLSRTEMDSLPTARYMQSLGSYVPGVHLNVPDVGGSQQIEQNYLSTHGANIQQDTYMLDGLLINTNFLDGYVQNYVDNSLVQESIYQTSGVGAEASAGGVLVNLIPKIGGNDFHGNIYLGGSSGSWQASNLDNKLLARGVGGQDAIDRIEDFDGSFGGPIKRDKLWFLVSGRKQTTYTIAGNSKYPNGSPGIQDAWIYTGSLRLTYQLQAKHRFTVMYERNFKTKLHEILDGGQVGIPVDPSTSATRREPVMYYIAQAKYTGTITPKLLIEGGFSIDKLNYYDTYQPGIDAVPFTPAWYTRTSDYDIGRNLRGVSGFAQQYFLTTRNYESVSASYITGSHQIRVGQQLSFGPDYFYEKLNGDGWQEFSGGATNFSAPLQFLAFDTPIAQKPYLDANLGFFAQDTWRYKRLSVTYGLRFEYLKASIHTENALPGRFVGARSTVGSPLANSQGIIDCNTVKGLGCFKDWAPRIGGVLDLFGNGKTALKAGFGKYMYQTETGFLGNFNPVALQTTPISWTDANQNGIADPGELGAVPVNFGTVLGRTLDPNYRREYALEYSAGIQHQIRNGIAVNFNWFRHSEWEQTNVINYAVPGDPNGPAWTKTSIINPLDGSTIPIYNLNPNYLGLTPNIHQSNAPQSRQRDTYTGFELSTQAHLPHGAFVYAGWTIERELYTNCDETMNTQFYNDPNSLRFCDVSGKLYQDLGKVPSLPFRNDFKVSSNIPTFWKLEVGLSLYSSPFPGSFAFTNPGSNGLSSTTIANFGYLATTWTINRNSVYPTNCVGCTPGARLFPTTAPLNQASETIQLVAPGQQFTDRLTQVDIQLKRTFHVKDRFSFDAYAAVYNLTNTNAVSVQTRSVGSNVASLLPASACAGSSISGCGIGGFVSTFTNPRILRLAMQFRF